MWRLTDISLRSRIYGYLLDGEYTRIKRTWSRKEYEDNFDNDRTGPRAYHFHTNILGVNRVIHDEAEELLYKRNMFIVLSYEWFGLGNENGGLLWLPIVSNKYAARMKSHSVRIHVPPGTAAYRDPELKGNASIQSAIILARDLDVFCLIMTTAGSSCKQSNLAVTLYKNGTGVPTIGFPGVFDPPNLTAPQFKCELRNTQYRKIGVATQRQILAPMHQILAPSQRVYFKGTLDNIQEVELLKQTMSPTLSCFPAYKWAFFKALSLAKDMADAAVPHDDIKFVMSLYHITAMTLAVCTFTHSAAPRQRQTFLLACPEAAEACEILYLEAMVNTACCAVKARDVKVLHEASDGIQKCRKRRVEEQGSWENIPPQLKIYCDNVELWKILYCGAQSDLLTVREAVIQLTGPSRERHQVHDSEVLLRHPDQEAVVTRKHLPLDQCSAFQLPLPSTTCHKTLLAQHEARFKGWLDMDILCALDDHVKNRVNIEQMQCRIKLTDFGKLLL